MRNGFLLAAFGPTGFAENHYSLTKREFKALERVLLRLRPGNSKPANPLAKLKPNEAISSSVFKNMEGHRKIDTAAFAYCLHTARCVYQRFPELVVCEKETRGYTEALAFWHEVVKNEFDNDALEMAQESVLRPDYEELLRSWGEEDAEDEQRMLTAHPVGH